MAIIPAGIIQTPAIGDQANAVVAGVFTAAAQKSPSFLCWGPFNLLIYGDAGPNGAWSGAVRLERSFDGGNTWIVCGIGGSGAQAVWPSAAGGAGADVSVIVAEPEKGVVYRLNCTVFTEGPINYRLSTTGLAPTALAIASVI